MPCFRTCTVSKLKNAAFVFNEQQCDRKAFNNNKEAQNDCSL